MATYKSQDTDLLAPADAVFSRLDNLEGLGEMIKNVPEEQIPADQRQMLEQVKVTSDTISFPGGPVGELTLRKVESVAPSLIRLEGEGTPVPLSLSLKIATTSAETCSARVEIDIQIPMMLKPMVNGPLQKMVDQFAQMLCKVPFNKN